MKTGARIGYHGRLLDYLATTVSMYFLLRRWKYGVDTIAVKLQSSGFLSRLFLVTLVRRGTAATVTSWSAATISEQASSIIARFSLWESFATNLCDEGIESDQ